MATDLFELSVLVVVLVMYYCATLKSRRQFSSALASLRLSPLKKFLLFFIHTVLFGFLLTLTFVFLALDILGVPGYFNASPAVALLLSGVVHFYYIYRSGNQDHT